MSYISAILDSDNWNYRSHRVEYFVMSVGKLCFDG